MYVSLSCSISLCPFFILNTFNFAGDPWFYLWLAIYMVLKLIPVISNMLLKVSEYVPDCCSCSKCSSVIFYSVFVGLTSLFPYLLICHQIWNLSQLYLVFNFKDGQVLGTYDDVFNSICSKFFPPCSLDKLCCPRWEHLFHVHSGVHLYPNGSPIKFLNVKSILQSYVCRFALPVFSILMALGCALMMAALWATLWPRCVPCQTLDLLSELWMCKMKQHGREQQSLICEGQNKLLICFIDRHFARNQWPSMVMEIKLGASNMSQIWYVPT
jgi:hypothetical protein